MNAPDLRTARLHLRPLQQSDLAPLHRHWSAPQVRRYLWDGQIVAPEQVTEIIRTSAQAFHQDRAGLWSLRRSDAPELLGCAGFWYFHEPPEKELLLSLSADYWGQGYAQEAADALMEYAFDVLEWPYVQGSADTPNERSLRLMQKLRMHPSGKAPGHFGTIEIYRISREAWREQRA